jgi:hypothetical protein
MSYLKTLKESEQLLTDREPFTTGTLSARYDTAGNYLVFSYDQMIAGWHNSGRTDLNSNYYSKTTSKHLNTVKRAWGLN